MASALLQAPGLGFSHLKPSSPPQGCEPALQVGVSGLRLALSRRFEAPRLRFSERRGCPPARVYASSTVSAGKDTASRADVASGGFKDSQVEEVVIVGGGIAGMATALALHRKGVKSILLEQSPTLRIAGTSLVVWTNGWRALEALGVAGDLKSRTFGLEGIDFSTCEGKSIASVQITDPKMGVEFQAVERKVLLETLWDPLPAGTVRFDSRVVKVHKLDGGYSQVELQNGSTIRTKILIGCDGIGSVVGKHLGLEHPHYAGYMGIRGVGVYPEGHSLKRVLAQVVGKGVRTGFLPLDSKRVYWFLVFNKPPGSKITDLNAIKEEALSCVQGWPDVVVDAIKHSAPETLNRSSVSDRWMLPFTSSKFFCGGVTVVGDAMHPVTPNLAQGGCCALEGAVILGRLLSEVLNSKDASTNGPPSKGGDNLSEMKRIELALSSYTSGRQERMLPLAATAYTIGAFLQIELDLVCKLRNLMLPKLVKPESFSNYALFDCGKLE